jgi:hypothetical protein
MNDVKNNAVTLLLVGAVLTAGGARLSAGPLPANEIYNEADNGTVAQVSWQDRRSSQYAHRWRGRGGAYRGWPAIIAGPSADNAFGPYGGPFIYGVPSYAYYACGPYYGGYYGFGLRSWGPYCYW